MPPSTASHADAACFVPIQSFDLNQDPLVDLFSPSFGGASAPFKTETALLQSELLVSHTPHVANPAAFLNAALPEPLQIVAPVKRRKRRAPPASANKDANGNEANKSPRIADTSSSETSDCERGDVKLQIRKIKNRASAAKSRLKAQARQELLEKNVVELHRQNLYLRDLVIAMAQTSGQPLPVLPTIETPPEAASHSPAYDVSL